MRPTKPRRPPSKRSVSAATATVDITLGERPRPARYHRDVKRTGVIAGGLALGLALLACGNGGRPSVAEWQPQWERVTATIPSPTELGDPPNVDVCRSVLGIIRSERETLFPTPDPALDPVVEEWVRVAEDAFFECPPSRAGIPDMAGAYAELRRLEAEVDVVLRIDTGDG